MPTFAKPRPLQLANAMPVASDCTSDHVINALQSYHDSTNSRPIATGRVRDAII